MMQGRIQWNDPVKPAPWVKPVLVGLGVVLVLGVGLGTYFMLHPRSSGNPAINDSFISGEWQDLVSNVDMRARAEVFRQSLESGAAVTDWPSTPQGVIQDFWTAASRKDYARMALLCPGSLEADFRHYFEHWTPSPAKAVGRGVPHASEPGVFQYPSRVDFPFFRNKTIKMAVTQLDDGRWIIDGRHTIWW